MVEQVEERQHDTRAFSTGAIVCGVSSIVIVVVIIAVEVIVTGVRSVYGMISRKKIGKPARLIHGLGPTDVFDPHNAVVKKHRTLLCQLGHPRAVLFSKLCLHLIRRDS